MTSTNVRLSKIQKAALLAAQQDPDGLLYINPVKPQTLESLIRLGLMELVSTFKGRPNVGLLTTTGRKVVK